MFLSFQDNATSHRVHLSLKNLWFCLTGLIVLLAVQAEGLSAKSVCRAPDAVCAARASVFAISSKFDAYGSAVRLSADLLVTNRHLVADELSAKVVLSDGRKIDAAVIPTKYPDDLVLLRAKLPPGPVARLQGASTEGKLFTIGAGLGRSRRIEVYPPGWLLALPAKDMSFARLHHTAYVQRGNSGGALVDGQGRLVGITSSGGEGRFEAISAGHIAQLRAGSDAQHNAVSIAQGKRYRDCYNALEKARHLTFDKWTQTIVERFRITCPKTQNRQLIDLVAQALGRARQIGPAIKYFQKSLALDPNGVNTRLSLVISLSFARRYQASIPHLRQLMKVIPGDTRMHELAIQAAKLTHDKALAADTLALINKHNPRGLAAAKIYLETKPRRRMPLVPQERPLPQSRPAN